MNKYFSKSFKENIIYNQKSLNDYHLALHKLLSAIQKGKSFNKEQIFLMKELVESIQNTIMDLQKLQIKKMGIRDQSQSSFFLQNDFSLSNDFHHLASQVETKHNKKRKQDLIKDQHTPTLKISIKNNTPSPPPRLFIDKKETKDK